MTRGDDRAICPWGDRRCFRPSSWTISRRPDLLTQMGSPRRASPRLLWCFEKFQRSGVVQFGRPHARSLPKARPMASGCLGAQACHNPIPIAKSGQMKESEVFLFLRGDSRVAGAAIPHVPPRPFYVTESLTRTGSTPSLLTRHACNASRLLSNTTDEILFHVGEQDGHDGNRTLGHLDGVDTRQISELVYERCWVFGESGSS